MAAVIYRDPGAYRPGFGSLLPPDLLALGTLAAARRIHPSPRKLEADDSAAPYRTVPPSLRLYLVAVSLTAVGFVDTR